MTLVLVLLVFMVPFIVNYLPNHNQPDTLAQSPNIEKQPISIKDIEYVLLDQKGAVKGAYFDNVIFTDKDKNLVDDIKTFILEGKVIENVELTDEAYNPIIIGIKQKDGSYYEGEYKENKILFYKPSIITIQTDERLECIIKDYQVRKLHTESQVIKYTGQVRNNDLIIGRTLVGSYTDDPVFKNFKGSDKSPEEYEKSLIKDAVELGIDGIKLKSSLDKAKEYKGNIKSQYPVIIETGTYRDKACFILTFTWGMDMDYKNEKVQHLGHIFTVIFDEDGKEIAYSSCK